MYKACGQLTPGTKELPHLKFLDVSPLGQTDGWQVELEKGKPIDDRTATREL